LAVGASTAIQLGVFPSAHATGTTSTLPGIVTGFYLDIGASASLGIQPDGVPGNNAKLTKTGYANDLVRLEGARGVQLQLRHTGCAGETAQSMLGPETPTSGEKCYKLPQRQLLGATQYLRAHNGQVGVVTIDLGSNDVRPCLNNQVVDVSCADQGISYVRQDMPKVLKDLQDAAGPNVQFVGLEYCDPFLGDYLNGSSGQVQAAHTLTVMRHLNQTLGEVYKAAGMAVANVPGAFNIDNTSPVTMSNGKIVPENVAMACEKTWWCHGPPWGPDDHPDDAGYLLTAKAIVAALPGSL
jgi:hypothetical protein